MADFVFNIAKGRAVELLNRVDANDPTNAAILLIPLSASGSEAQGQDFDTLSDVLGDANFDEATGSNWARKTLVDSAVSLGTPDDANNRFDLALDAAQTWSAVAASNNTTGLLVCYDSDTTGGTDANIIPISHHTFVVTTDGNDVVLNAGDILRAS